jgi:hypothetical protein
LKAYGIDQGAHHGGDMVGNGCKKFLSNSTAIMGHIKALLSEVGDNNDMTQAAIMAGQTRCDLTSSLLQQYDGFFSWLRIPKEDMTEQSVLNAKTFISNGMQFVHALQMSVTPKGHACESHACAQMVVEKGLGDLDEEFVERWHQEGTQNDVRTRAMREQAKKFVSVSRWEQMNRNPKAVIKQEVKREFTLSQETRDKRKKSRDDNPRASEKKLIDEQRQITRQEALQTFPCPNDEWLTADQENYKEHTGNDID